ncbi:MAG: sulfur carrier protein ThiS [Phyllobacterium sp.]
MKVIVNGEEQGVKASFLDDLLVELAFDGEWLATAVNSELVPAAERQSCRLSEGDRVEILTPRQGG